MFLPRLALHMATGEASRVYSIRLIVIVYLLRNLVVLFVKTLLLFETQPVADHAVATSVRVGHVGHTLYCHSVQLSWPHALYWDIHNIHTHFITLQADFDNFLINVMTLPHQTAVDVIVGNCCDGVGKLPCATWLMAKIIIHCMSIHFCTTTV